MIQYNQYPSDRWQCRKGLASYRSTVSSPGAAVSYTSHPQRFVKSENYTPFAQISRGYSSHWSSSEELSISSGSRSSTSLSLRERKSKYQNSTHPSEVRGPATSFLCFLANLLFRCLTSKRFLLLVLPWSLFLLGVWYSQSYIMPQNGFSSLKNEKSQVIKTTDKINEHWLLHKVKNLENVLQSLTFELRNKQDNIWHQEVSSLLQKLQSDPQITEYETESMTQKHEKIPLKRQMLMKEELAEIKEMIKEMQKIKEETEYLFEVLPSWSQNDPEYQVKAIVNRALKLYSEDRIGLADYALESAGASVLTAYCSETYEKQQIIVTLFGIPLWYRQQSPNVILQPDVYPGNCWAFAGDKGFVTIKLASRIKPTAFTLDHIPKSVSPIGSINTAPRDFSIFGISDPADMTMNLLGKYTYDKNGSPIQTFLVQANPVRSYNIIRMNVDSNWGHPEYTCIYRLRVHGELMN